MAIVIILILIIAVIPFIIKEEKENNKMKSYIDENSLFANDYNLKRNELIRKGYNTDGIYILNNIDKGNYRYVGQSVNVVNRLDQHLRGSSNGNSDVYNAIINGDRFVITVLKLKDTNFNDLNALEKFYITKYDTYYNGYNRTRGNRSIA